MLSKKFYDLMRTDTIATAKALLGMDLLLDGKRLGRIVETEAYLGSKDSACHSANNRRTPKNESMYLAAGHWYIYQIYGHQMLNLVTKPQDIAEAVLIRALETADGNVVANGPGKLTKFAGIDKAFDGKSIESSKLQLKENLQPLRIAVRPRIGVTCTDDWRNEPLCFYVSGNRHVSRISKKSLLPDQKTWNNKKLY
ncbi:DNA-3-methyladenine glycosylase [Streptococcus macacae]|uniref:Putative 3-methyladenine DNA glycosylase n=1 Tax=Streptococcus macacae NCTC 11558 TaxID=764298 RepID=G5JX26_9STRE|nr:DNA-3-methyladenine glycosylase [Streptococcus macacae]EHJ52109.1 DNA-3-methyladenine glycosylase [Streptococcus macacae NCTC 11558]SUN79505.1 3-methyladenine DNA glycosylase [Streptococcus macacae NCTC 11558]